MAIRVRQSIAGILIVGVSLFALPGCGGPSKEEQAKQDEQGKQTNEEAMKRMMQEQGRTGGMPGTMPGATPGTTQGAMPGTTPGATGP